MSQTVVLPGSFNRVPQSEISSQSWLCHLLAQDHKILNSTFERHLSGLEHLKNEKDPALLSQGLFSIALKLEQEDLTTGALTLYEYLKDPSHSAPLSIRRRAEERLNFMKGEIQDPLALLEFTGHHLLKSLKSPSTLAGFALGGVLGSAAELWFGKALLRNAPGLLTRGILAEGFSGLAGIGAEALGFTFMEGAFGGFHQSGLPGLRDSALSNLIFVGAMRGVTGPIGYGIRQWAAGSGLMQSFTRAVMPQIALLGSMMTAHRAQEMAGFRKEKKGWAFVAEGFVDAAQAVGVGLMTNALFGKSLGRVREQMQSEAKNLWQTQGLSPAKTRFPQNVDVFADWLFGGRGPHWAWATAGGMSAHETKRIPPRPVQNSVKDLSMAMSSLGEPPSTGRSAGQPVVPPKFPQFLFDLIKSETLKPSSNELLSIFGLYEPAYRFALLASALRDLGAPALADQYFGFAESHIRLLVERGFPKESKSALDYIARIKEKNPRIAPHPDIAQISKAITKPNPLEEDVVLSFMRESPIRQAQVIADLAKNYRDALARAHTQGMILTAENPITIGSAPGNLIQGFDERISPRHAQIGLVENDGVFVVQVRDLGSTNGVKVEKFTNKRLGSDRYDNREYLLKNGFTNLAPGDWFEISPSQRFFVQIGDAGLKDGPIIIKNLVTSRIDPKLPLQLWSITGVLSNSIK